MNNGDKQISSQRLLLHESADLGEKRERRKINSSNRPEPQEHQYLLEQENLILDDDNDSLSEDEAQKERENKINDILNKQNLKEAAAKKMVVGTGFTMDVTQFFQFKRKELRSGEDVGIFQQITGSRIAWVILLYSVTTGAMIPGWIMKIDANKYLRISWRFILQMMTVIPFVLYQYRNGSEAVRQKYSFKYIFKKQHLIKPLISALSASMWFTLILGSFVWTSVSHAIVLGSLSNFFLSLGRSYNKVNHDLELGGQVLVCGGLFLVIYDSITFGPNNQSPHYYDFDNYVFLQRTWWQRVTFDLIAFFVSFVMAQSSKFTSDLGRYYPPFLSMFIVQNLNWIIMSFSAFFVNGCEFSYDSFWGFFSIFSSKHFAGFMFMGIMLSTGQIVSLALITRMFPDPIIPALAMTLDPFIASLIVNITGVQALPGTVSLIGYIFVIPGLCLILVGQCLYNRISAKSQQNEDKSKELMKELKELRQRRLQREKRNHQREQRKKEIMKMMEAEKENRARSG